MTDETTISLVIMSECTPGPPPKSWEPEARKERRKEGGKENFLSHHISHCRFKMLFLYHLQIRMTSLVAQW